MSIETRLEGRLLRLTLNRPEKRNALDLATCTEITAALEEADRDPKIGAVLLAGAGKSFCAGMDLSEAPHADRTALADAHDKLFTIYDWVEKPLIAAVQGWAIAGGTGLAANAHILIASEEAQFGLTEVKLGLWPVLIYPSIVRAVGERRALELSLSGRFFSARDAEWYGLVNEVVTVDRLMDRALEIAGEIANSSGAAVRLGLDYVRRIRGKSQYEALEIGRGVRDEIMLHPDFAEGVASFREKRAPVWPSHRI